MIKTYRFFDYAGTAQGLTVSIPKDMKQLFKENRNIKRVEVYERLNFESIWEETYLKTYYAKDFK